jgi:hypothetical protein
VKKAILHIGSEKTGSTSIQHFCRENSQVMLDDYKTLYPVTPGRTNHTKLALYSCNQSRGLNRFLNTKKFENLGEFRGNFEKIFLAELEEKNKQWETLLLSCEWLHPRMQSPDEFERLRKLLVQVVDDTEIVIYLRRQDKLAQSIYSTALKAGSTHAFKLPLVKNQNAPYFYNFLSIYKNWVEVFGKANVKIRIFDKEKLIGQDVVTDFLEYLSFEGSDFKYSRNVNLSLSDEGIVLMRAFNEFHNSESCDLSEGKAREIRRKIASSFSGKANLATKKELDLFKEKFSKMNSDLFDEYFTNTGVRISF